MNVLCILLCRICLTMVDEIPTIAIYHLSPNERGADVRPRRRKDKGRSSVRVHPTPDSARPHRTHRRKNKRAIVVFSPRVKCSFATNYPMNPLLKQSHVRQPILVYADFYYQARRHMSCKHDPNSIITGRRYLSLPRCHPASRFRRHQFLHYSNPPLLPDGHGDLHQLLAIN